MKKITTIIFFLFLSLNAQTKEQVNKQLKDADVTADEAKQMAKDQGVTDQQIKSEMGSIDENNDNQLVDENSSPITKEVIVIDGVTYIKDGLRYIPVLSDKSKVIKEQAVLDARKDYQKQELDELDFIEEDEEKNNIDEDREATSYYGYEIFQGDPSAFQASTFGAVDPNYNIGPGDQIIVMLWGEFQSRQEFTINREGYVFVPEVGQVFVNGLNLETLEKKFFQILSKVYSTLNPATGKPTTFIDISLGNLRPLRIIVLGEIGQPGVYSVSPSTSLSSSLYYFRGPTMMGSLRDIRLLRKNKLVGSIDFYDYLLSGSAPEDLRLQLDDIVFIPPRGKSIAISGEINRPAIYELRENEGLKDLIEIAGGLRPTAHMDHAQIDRIVAPENRGELGMDRMLVDLDLSDILQSKEDYPLEDGDHINLFSIFDSRGNSVSIRGAVMRSGTYDYGPGMTLRDLIMRADGLSSDAYLERVDIVRVKPDLTEKLLKLNIRAAMADSMGHNILIQAMDRVRIYSLTEMVARKSVSIIGHVKNPGRYILRDNMNIYDLVFKAGGLVDDEWLKKTYMDRADLIRYDNNNITRNVVPFNLGELIKNPKNLKNNWDLVAGDLVRVYSKTMFNVARSVSIDGSVRNPGTYKMKSNMTIKDLILEAGGVSQDVYSYKIELARIDPLNTNRNIYAKILRLDMANDFSVSNIEYQSSINSSAIEVKRNEFTLKPYDRISIRPDPNFTMHRTVNIMGEINYPGQYTLISPQDKVSDIINRAGGLREEAYPRASVLIRNNDTIRVSFEDIIKNNRSKDNFILKDGDNIIINTNSNIVTMVGEVHTPGKYKFHKGKNIRQYVSLSGGLTTKAEQKDIWVTYPDGTSAQFKRFLPSPRIYDGSVITVGTEDETEPLNKTEFAKDIASIIADFLQIYISLTILIRTASNI